MKSCVKMFREADVNVIQGPSVIYREPSKDDGLK